MDLVGFGEGKLDLAVGLLDERGKGVERGVFGVVMSAALLGEIVAVHVIPRPHADVEKILPSLK